MRKRLLSAVAALALTASAASATVYNITDILDGTYEGFGFSLFHGQTGGRMSGSMLEDPDVLFSGGTWDTGTGAINFGFTLAGGGSVTAAGTLSVGSAYGTGGQYLEVGGTIQRETHDVAEAFRLRRNSSARLLAVGIGALRVEIKVPVESHLLVLLRPPHVPITIAPQNQRMGGSVELVGMLREQRKSAN